MIILAATPIGNLGDASPRLRTALAEARLVASEDTRVTQRLLAALGIENRPKLIALHEHNERQKAAELVELARDADLLVLSDAGMPTVSDPGFPLVAAAAAAGVLVTAIPGPSAVVTALALSGLPTDRFAFEGFLPRKAGERARRLASLATEERTLVFFEAPHRTEVALRALAEAFGEDRRAAVCRELTKTHEEVRRGGLAELADWAADGVRGEVTLVVEGAAAAGPVTDPEVLAARVAEAEAAGQPRKDAIAAVAKAAGVPKREVYDLVHRKDR